MEAVIRRIPYHRPDIFKLYPLGDIHAGTIYCNEAKIRKQVLEIQRDPFALWVGMGDYADLVLEKDWRFEDHNIAEWVQKQNIPESQCQWLTHLFEPIRNKCLGLLEGNHETEVRQKFSYNFTHNLAERLGVAELGYSCVMRLVFHRVNSTEKHEFKCWFMHGSGSPQTEGGRMMNLQGALSAFHGDIYCKGHIHSLMTHSMPYLDVTETDPPRIINRVKCGAITGSWFETYKQGIVPSYGEKKCYKPSAIGCPVFLVCPNKASVAVFDNASMMASQLVGAKN